MAVADPASAAARLARRPPTLSSIMAQTQGLMTPGKDEVAAQKEVQAREAEQSAALERNRSERQRITGAEAERAEKAEAALPDLPTVPKAEKEEIPPDHNPMQAMQKFMPMLIMLGGAANKHLGMAALKSAVGAMKGQKSGDLEAQEAAHQKWLDDTKAAMEAYELQSKNYQNVLEKFKITDESAKNRVNAQLQALAADNGDFVTRTALAKGNYQELFAARTAQQNALKEMHSMLTAEQQLANERSRIGLESKRLQEEERYHKAEEEFKRLGLDPVKGTYNRALEDGKTPEEAAKIAGKVALSVHPEIKTRLAKDIERSIAINPTYKAEMKVIEGADTVDTIKKKFLEARAKGQNISAQDQGLILDQFIVAATGRSPTYQQLNLQKNYSGASAKVAEMQQYLGKGGVLGPDQVKNLLDDFDLLRTKAEANIEKIRQGAAEELAMGEMSIMPPDYPLARGESGGYPTPPQEYVDMLLKSPDDIHKQAFDFRFGAGAADAVLREHKK